MFVCFVLFLFSFFFVRCGLWAEWRLDFRAGVPALTISRESEEERVEDRPLIGRHFLRREDHGVNGKNEVSKAIVPFVS